MYKPHYVAADKGGANFNNLRVWYLLYTNYIPVIILHNTSTLSTYMH